MIRFERLLVCCETQSYSEHSEVVIVFYSVTLIIIIIEVNVSFVIDGKLIGVHEELYLRLWRQNLTETRTADFVIDENLYSACCFLSAETRVQFRVCLSEIR
jgi:hypothetical protein